MENYHKQKQEKEERRMCLEYALNMYGSSKYVAGLAKEEPPQKIIDAAKAFQKFLNEG